MNRLFKLSSFWPCLAISVPGLILVATSTGFNGLYGQDSFEYLRYSRAIHEHFHTGAPVGTFYWPVLYPLAGSLLSFILPDILALQLISLLCYGLTGYFMEKILTRLFPGKEPEVRVFVLLFYCLSPFVLRYSLTVMSELPALFLITAFYYQYLLYSETRNPGAFLWLVISGTGAVLTRYPAFIVICIPFIHSCFLFWRNFSPLHVVLAVTGAGLLVFAEFILHGQWTGSILARPHFADWSPAHFIIRSFLTADGHLEYKVPNIVYVLKGLVFPGFIFAGALFLAFFRIPDLKRGFLAVALATWMIYSIFLSGLTFQNDRVLLLGFPLVMFLYTAPFLRVSGWLKLKKTAVFPVAVILVLLVQGGLFVRAFKPFYENSRTAKLVSDEIRQYPGRIVYTFNMDQALQAYRVKNPVISLYLEQPVRFEPSGLVLFNTVAFSRQWAGYNPMINWERLNAGHHLKVLRNFPEGWVLYEIKD